MAALMGAWLRWDQGEFERLVNKLLECNMNQQCIQYTNAKLKCPSSLPIRFMENKDMKAMVEEHNMKIEQHGKDVTMEY